jgi:two-component sensor histidine kinase
MEEISVPLHGESSVVLLAERPARAPDHEGETHAWDTLLQALAERPCIDELLDRLVQSARVLCQAHSAGLNLREQEGERELFRWRALAGAWGPFPRDLSSVDGPESVVLERNEAMLLLDPARHHAWVRTIPLPICEALLAPVEICGQRGTIWVLAHEPARHFDSEDVRILKRLGSVAASASRLLSGDAAKGSEAHYRRLQQEAQHRNSNLFSVIQSIARLSLRGPLFDEVRPKFEARLQALARVDRKLMIANGGTLLLDVLVRSEFEAFGDRIAWRGPELLLSQSQAQSLALALHELSINARRHGALSCKDGRIRIDWMLGVEAGGRVLKLTWRESGGPSVRLPERAGFGTTILRAIFSRAEFDYAAQGLACTLELALPESPLAPQAPVH